MDTWDPERYARFAAERAEPFHDLLDLVRPVPGGRVADLGCGSGELTAELHRRLEAGQTLGLDSSPAMLQRARPLAGDGLRFELGDIADFDGGGWDVVFSNAALQWLPDHEALFGRLVGALAAGGQLAVQMPANFDHPSHVVADELAGEEPFRSALGGWRGMAPIRPPEWYALLLDRLGLTEQQVRLQVYLHHLADREQVVEWVRGTLLTAYAQRLPAELFERFLDRYRERLLPQLDGGRPYRYPFKRVLLWARRPPGDPGGRQAAGSGRAAPEQHAGEHDRGDQDGAAPGQRQPGTGPDRGAEQQPAERLDDGGSGAALPARHRPGGGEKLSVMLLLTGFVRNWAAPARRTRCPATAVCWRG